MDILAQVIIILSLTLISYWLFTLLHFPAPAMMGPIIAIGALQIWGAGFHVLPASIINIFQIIIGLSVGARINHKRIGDIRKIGTPSLVIAVYTLASTAIFTMLIHNFTADYPTALFSAAPGGISEMTVLALAYRSEIAVITTFQFVRLIVILSVIPLITRFVEGRSDSREVQENIQTVHENDVSETIIDLRTGKDNQRDIVVKNNCQERNIVKSTLMYGGGILGGLFLIALGFPGGGVIGSMIAFGSLNVIFREEFIFPRKVFQIALFGVGITIGLEFSPLMAQKIQEMLLPIVGFSILIVLGNLIVAWLIRAITKWDITTCLLSCSPGGLSQMLVIGEEMKADTFTISILQLVRVITIIICIPIVAALIS